MRDISYVLAKKEVAPGTAVALSGATDAMLVVNYAVTPFNSTGVRREIDLPFAGRRPQIPTAVHAAHNFDVEIAGSGATLTPAFWAVFLNACLFDAPTLQSGYVQYPLGTTDDGGAITFAGYKDSAKHPAKGMRGNVKFSFTEKQLPKMSFAMLGIIDGALPMTSAVAGALTLPVYPQPVEVNLQNTALIMNAYTCGMRSLEIDLGNKTTLFSTTGQKTIVFDKAADGDRRSAGMTGVIELPDPALKNYFTSIINATPINFGLSHGTVAGNIFNIGSGNGLILTGATYTTENGRLFMNFTGDLVPTAAGNELLITTS